MSSGPWELQPGLSLPAPIARGQQTHLEDQTGGLLLFFICSGSYCPFANELKVHRLAMKSSVLSTSSLWSQSGEEADSSTFVCPKWAFTPLRPLLSAQVA